MNALLFDCDGVLGDTERDGHLPAFNTAFAEFGLPLRWSRPEYCIKLAIGGGKERLASVFTPEFMREAKLPEDAESTKDLIARLHERKTEIFTELVEAGKVPPRPGVARLAHGVHGLGWRLAVASTSTLRSVRAVLATVVGPDFAKAFEIYAGDVVPRKKPAPDIYEYALERLGIDSEHAIVVEDSHIGLRAALGARLCTIVTLSAFTQDEDVRGAALVVSSLGEPGAEPIVVRANDSGIDVGSYVSVEDVVGLLATPSLPSRLST